MHSLLSWTPRAALARAAVVALAAAAGACSDDPAPGADASAADAAPAAADAAPVAPDAAEVADGGAPAEDAAEGADAAETPDGGMAGQCTAATVPCQDESVQALVLYRTPNNALITNTATTGGFISQIDTTGGGFSPTRSYVYAQFTDTGLTRVNIGDEQAFESLDWDLGMRRFVVRLNSGVSGPSCVVARRAPPNLSFDEVASVPAGAPRVEEYMTPAPACALVSDGSGLESSPGTALQSFWEYPGCVKMTGNVFVLTLRSGRSVKLQVLSYYTLANQRLCDTEGRVNMPSGSGQLRIKWAFLP